MTGIRAKFAPIALMAGAAVGGVLLWWSASVPEAIPVPTASESLTPTQLVLKQIGLQTSDLAGPATAVLAVNGNRLRQPTLNLCDGDFPSEAKRLVRRLTNSVESDGTVAAVATDVVQYESIAAAAEALSEVRAQAVACGPTGGVGELAASALDTTGEAFAAVVQSHVDEELREHMVLWQVRGNVLVVLSLSVSPSESHSDVEWSEFKRLATLITTRLEAIDPVEIGYF